MDIEIVKARYRSPDCIDYPELAGYAREEIYDGCMGGGALYLAAQMTRTMDLKEGDIVLDLGCGLGMTSIFLAREFGVRVVAVDLWTSATSLAARFSKRAYRDRILPLNLDVTDRLPFADAYFDAIFCMNSLSFYGGSVGFLHHLLKHVKRGGQICVGMETFNQEFSPEGFSSPPPVFDYNLPSPHETVNVWEDDFSKMHSPPWWKHLFEKSGILEVEHCRELEDAAILYEDLVLYQIEHDLEPEDVRRSVAQLEYGRENRPYKTLFVLTARKL